MAAWPSGVDGPLTIDAATVTIPAGSVKDYSSILISASGTLRVLPETALTIGSSWK